MISLRYVSRLTFGGSAEWTTCCLDIVQMSFSRYYGWHSGWWAFNANVMGSSLESFPFFLLPYRPLLPLLVHASQLGARFLSFNSGGPCRRHLLKFLMALVQAPLSSYTRSPRLVLTCWDCTTLRCGQQRCYPRISPPPPTIYLYMVSFINITLLISNIHSIKYHLLFWLWIVKKINLSINNLCKFHWYTLGLLISHLWMLFIHIYNFKYILLSLLQSYYLGMYSIIWYLKIFTYCVTQARRIP